MKLIKKIFLYSLIPLGLVAIVGGILWAKDQYEEYQYLQSLTDTASPQVQILSDTAYIDYLDKKRTLHIYLPPNYEQDTAHYPVLYFLDGDALFSDIIMQGPEWQLDEVLDSMATIGKQKAIVIGIENSEKRMTEYKPWLSPHVPSENSVTGQEHAEWIATDLKAWVDTNYRTLPDPDFTSIGGSSLGGLMAYYMVMEHNDVFHNAFVFSPSFWVHDTVYTLHQGVDSLAKLNIYFNAGELETPIMEGARKMHGILLAAGMPEENMQIDIEPELGHWHATWRLGFRKAYPWLSENF